VRGHIKRRVSERQISEADLRALQRWAALEPESPNGNWFKRFPSFTLCGTAEMPKTLLLPDMTPYGEEIF
jgi:hypothetical protein